MWHNGYVTCDIERCESESALLAIYPYCRVCLRDICPEHQAAGSVQEDGIDEATCVCCDCHDA